MTFPKTVKDYWQLSRETRTALFQNHGFGWQTITEGISHNKNDDEQKIAGSGEQTKLDLFGEMKVI